MNIIEIIQKLNFPKSEYIVIGGASMAIRNIKETRDVDILVSKSLINELKNYSNWSHHPRINREEEAGLINNDKQVELYPTIANDTVTFEELKSREEVIGGIPVANLIDVIRIKEYYNREKDKKDIELIRLYLATKS